MEFVATNDLAMPLRHKTIVFTGDKEHLNQHKGSEGEGLEGFFWPLLPIADSKKYGAGGIVMCKNVIYFSYMNHIL